MHTLHSAPVVLAMGTRPEIIKMAPVALCLQRLGVPVRILHTGQHDEEMALPLYRFFGLVPHASLTLERRQPGLAALSAELLDIITAQLTDWRPSAVLVHGDTSSAAMAALAAFYQRIPVGHVEAGLRSGQIYEPFPEEMNRRLIGQLATWHFAPTARAVSNLRREGLEEGVFEVGNTVVDAVRWADARLRRMAEEGAPLDVPALDWFARTGCSRLVLVTAHRRENWEAMSQIASAVNDILLAEPGLAVVWPLHPNPAVQQAVRTVHDAVPEAVRRRWLLVAPQDYPSMVSLMVHSDVLLSDSGGVQEEGASLHRPVLVLRNVTERPELISSGAGRLVGTDRRQVAAHTLELLRDAAARQRMQTPVNPFGDGQTGQRIARLVAQGVRRGGAVPPQAAEPPPAPRSVPSVLPA